LSVLSAFSDYTRFLQELAGRDTQTAQEPILAIVDRSRKLEKERKRIEKEQAYINAGSWDDWDKMEEENEKERVKEQTRLDQKRKQEIEERAAKREALRQASTTRIPPSPVRE
jgi:hypothetical protein